MPNLRKLVKPITVPGSLAAWIAVFVCILAQPSAALGPQDASTAIHDFNKAFLVTSGKIAYYKKSLSNPAPAGTWVAALDIMGEEDAYERTGSPAQQTLVNNLCATWLQKTQPPWTWDGWNDDIGWFTMALIRGYQMTGNPQFLTQAEYGFNMAYNRGWDTQYNGGGIWEQQPSMTPAGQKVGKEALSNDSLGIVACMIYQSTHDATYLTKAQQIYDWVWHHLYNANSGQINTGVDRQGKVDTGTAVYNQGSFVDYANLLYQITGNINYYNDAKRSIDYVKNNMTTDGVISNSAGYLNTWADEFARGLGHFVRDNHQWSNYYPWMVQNANAILSHCRTDDGITWNGWAQQTPNNDALDASQFVSAVSWLQFTPAKQPSRIEGVHTIVSKLNGIAIDNGGGFSAGGSTAGVVLWGKNGGQNQKWDFLPNEDGSWRILSESSWQVLADPEDSAKSRTQVIQSDWNGGSRQHWWVRQQANGSDKIRNQHSGLVLDSTRTSTNGHPLTQQVGNGKVQQLWLLH